MTIDQTTHLRRLVMRRSLAARAGVPAESIDLDAELARPGADDVVGRVEKTLRAMPAEEIGDPAEFRRALDILLRETHRATAALDRDPSAPLSPGEVIALEAVVRTDGTRPTLLIRDDAVDPGHPLAGDWSGSLAATRERLREAIRAVGRIEPANPTARSYFGTGWVVDAGRGLVLTNLHVAEEMWRRVGHRMVRSGNKFRVLDGVFIDFAVEAGSTRDNRFRVVEVTIPAIDGPGLERLDAAVLRIEPIDGQHVPPAIAVHADPDGPRGNLASFCVVGFPGPPPYSGGFHEGIDWTWVTATLFGNRYGVKRLAPGVTHRPLGSFHDDPRRWVFGHDVTTLGGSSGSPLLGWLDAVPGAFGLHFAGASVDTNYAHAVVAAAEGLRAMGVPV